MKIVNKLCLKYKIRKDEKFLLKKGFEKTKERGLEIIVGNERLGLENPKGEIKLPTNNGRTDIRKIIALIADDYPEITKRYLSYTKKLKNYL
jgi:hypothetical protein